MLIAVVLQLTSHPLLMGRRPPPVVFVDPDDRAADAERAMGASPVEVVRA
jgi:hypothetical protein